MCGSPEYSDTDSDVSEAKSDENQQKKQKDEIIDGENPEEEEKKLESEATVGKGEFTSHGRGSQSSIVASTDLSNPYLSY